MRVLVNGESFEVEVVTRERDAVTFKLADRVYRVQFERDVPSGEITVDRNTGTAGTVHAASLLRSPAAGKGAVLAPIPGVVAAVLVREGDRVTAGDVLLRLEAMKMENKIFSPWPGTVKKVCVSTGEEVSGNQLLVEIEMGASSL